jgi:hypothetical protein
MISEDEKQPDESVAGECVGFKYDGRFHYRYECESCGGKFRTTSPTASRPVVCHSCYNGLLQKQNERARTRNLAAYHKRVKGNK